MLKHRIAEGIPLCLGSMDLDRWGRELRVPHRLALLKGYGGSAKPVLPELRALRSQFKSEADRAELEDVIRTIEEGEAGTPLVSLHTLVDERLARDLAAVEGDRLRVLVCRQMIEQRSGDVFYQAACLRWLVALLGVEAFGDVASALGHEEEILHEVALTLGSQPPLRGLTEDWAKERAEAGERKRAAIQEILGKDGA